jgi:hypothetical protein
MASAFGRAEPGLFLRDASELGGGRHAHFIEHQQIDAHETVSIHPLRPSLASASSLLTRSTASKKRPCGLPRSCCERCRWRCGCCPCQDAVHFSTPCWRLTPAATIPWRSACMPRVSGCVIIRHHQQSPHRVTLCLARTPGVPQNKNRAFGSKAKLSFKGLSPRLLNGRSGEI